MPDRVKEKLVELLKSAFGTSFNAPYFREHELEPLADHLIAHGVTVQEWIPVTERLPDKAGDYLIYATVPFNGRNFIAVMHYDKDEYCPIWQDTSHWMPLPQPPKGE